MENFNNISKFIKENDLDLFSDVSDDLICIICKGIMINATSAPCQCRYCYECIKKYLKGKRKLSCPGSGKYCKLDKLRFEQDIQVDNTINNRISKLIVKCPQKSCEFKCELCLIKDHIEICDKRSVDCPYLQLGCNKEDVQLNNMKPHLYDDSFIHNKLLIEYINNFKNDVEILKYNMKTMEDENVTLKEQIKRKEVALNEIIERIQNENKNMKEEINVLLSEIETLKSTQINEERRGHIINVEEKQNLLEEDAANEFVFARFSESTDTDDNLDSLKSRIENIENQFTTYKDEEFVWTIDNIIEKVNESNTIYSDPFYTHKNGYKMCLYMFPNKFPNRIGVFFSIMKGPFDDILPWPCNMDVTTGLILQDMGVMFHRKTKKFVNNISHDVYKNPTFARNKGCLALKYFELSQLLSAEKLIKNNKLFIKCTVHINQLF